jgi:spore coat protein A
MKRRDFSKIMAAAGAGAMLPWRKLRAVPAAVGLSDPALQPKFANLVPDAMAPSFMYQPDRRGRYKVKIGAATQYTGLVDGLGNPLPTPIWGYADQMDRVYSWPGKTFEVKSVSAGGPPETEVVWANALNGTAAHLLPVDTNLHWCYSLHNYMQHSIASAGVPIITHLHGGHTDWPWDGNPEFFYGPELKMGKGKGSTSQVVGPQWANVPGGFSTKFRYDNDVPAGNLWYHDHALGITRLNVYAGLAGFYFVRDGIDTGKPGNYYNLPAWPYEKAYAIQCRMFRDTGQLFYPAFPGDPFYDDFITGEGAVLPTDIFPGGGPTALAEFFGDHMVVNGIIWPKENVEPRKYRLHLLNGTDSRFMVVRFRVAASPNSTSLDGAGLPVPFTVIGSDQGLGNAQTMDTLVFEPGSRYDIVFDFAQVPAGSRVIMENIGGDAPFGGDFGDALLPEDFFPDRQTDRVMAFDVVLPKDTSVPDAGNPLDVQAYGGNGNAVTNTRKVALFEGMDEFGRLQPLLGTAEPTVDAVGNVVNGSVAWHSPTTENPALDSTEIWEIYNATGDAHPVHLHLVNFEVLGRQEFTADAIEQPIVQHNGAVGTGFRLENITLGAAVPQPLEYFENSPKDMVTALPGHVTRIKATFDKPGRYVWHCHILSHEDHEMMRVLHVGPGA